MARFDRHHLTGILQWQTGPPSSFFVDRRSYGLAALALQQGNPLLPQAQEEAGPMLSWPRCNIVAAYQDQTGTPRANDSTAWPSMEDTWHQAVDHNMIIGIPERSQADIAVEDFVAKSTR